MKRVSLFFDFVVIAFLGLFSRFLMNSSLRFQYLATGYQDWIYHAFRIERILSVGITSWDHIWSNGVNYWKVYQYVPHLLTAGLVTISHDSVTHGMIVMSWLLILVSMISSYLFLRSLKISSIASLIAILLFWTTPVLWNESMRDFSIFFAIGFLPFFLYLFSLDAMKQGLSLRVPALAGISWAIHPVLGTICSGLFIFYTFTKWVGKRGWYLLLPIIIFLATSALFSIPYLLSGYHYTSSDLSDASFVRQTINPNNFGFGLLMSVVFILTSIGMIVFVKRLPHWAKLMTTYSILIYTLIQLTLINALPKFVYMFQLSRSVFMLSMLIMFSSAAVLHQLLKVKTRFISFIAAAVLAVLLVQVIDISSSNLAPSVQKLDDPISSYFKNHPLPEGTVWVDDVSRASYFTASENIRFSTSYNRQMEQSPISSRLNNLMQNDLPFTGITKKQVDLINAYSRVLGIEYIFLPKLSSLVDSITSTSSGSLEPSYNQVDATSTTGQFAVLQNKSPIAHAYIYPKDSNLLAPPPTLPTLAAESWTGWDNNIQHLDDSLRSQTFQKVDVSFPSKETLNLYIPHALGVGQGILLMESYDSGWKSSTEGVKITPTNTRFIFLELPQGWNGKLTLTHYWPSWQWPLQIFSFGLAGVVLILESIWFFLFRRKGSHV